MEALAIALVTALATKAFETIGEKTGENVVGKATSLIKSLFQPTELISLNLSAEHLSQENEQKQLAETLVTRLADKPYIAQELQALIDTLKAHSESKASNFANQTNFGKTINVVGDIKELNM